MTSLPRVYPVLRHRRSGKLLVGTLRSAITADKNTSRGLLHLFGGARLVRAENVVLVGCAQSFDFRSYEVARCEPSLAWCQGARTVEAKP